MVAIPSIPAEVFINDMNIAIEDYYEDVFHSSVTKSTEFIAMHFLTKRDLIKGMLFPA